MSAFAIGFFLTAGLVFLGTTNIKLEAGGYVIDQVIVSNNLADKQRSLEPIVFHPSDTIFCTVTTIGVDGIIGIRWFSGDEMISEGIGRTENNVVSGYIMQSSPDGLPEGSYDVEVYVVEDQPIEKIYFEVKNKPIP